MRRDHPIARRLDRLYQQWEAFAGDREAKVLRWLVRADELRMLEALLAIEDTEDGELPALFVVLSASFTVGRYDGDLARQLEDRLATFAPVLAELELPPWPSRELGVTPNTASLMLRCIDVARHLDQHLEQLVLVLWPERVDNPEDFPSWLARAARLVPERVRMVVIDRAESPGLESLVVREPKRVRSVVADLDMAGALVETAATAPHGDDGGGRYRAAYVAMSAALQRQEIANARLIAEQAETIARESGFTYLEAATPFGLATGLLAANELDAALEQFGRAEQLADAAASVDADHEWARPLQIKARLGVAAVLFSHGAWKLAADHYATAATWAAALDDHATQFEALRMAAACHERDDASEDAWAAAIAALSMASTLEDRALQQSSAAWLGEQLMRATSRGTAYEHARPRIERELAEMLGFDWRARTSLSG